MNRIGVMLNNLERDRLRAFGVARSLGFDLVHANALPESWLSGPQRDEYIAAARASGITLATLFVGFDGQDYSNIRAVHETVGIVRSRFRLHRLAIARKYKDLAEILGVPSLSMHLGFLPTEPSHPDYVGVVEGLRGLLDECAGRGQAIHLETGQENAVGFIRLLRAVDRPNLRVNFDPANFVLYGTDSPLGALELLHPWIAGVHCKDALPATTPGELGRETALGQGAVDFPLFLKRLSQLGYSGPLVIEREQAENAVEGILAARTYLEGLAKARFC
jgi:L-ribulose-5-phosphate 3-epimerase